MKIFMYKAADAPIVAILLRGVKRTHWKLIRWDLDTDTFIEGQWLMNKSMNGAYASISPSGEYFSYSYSIYPKTVGSEYECHCAVSKLPNFTALYFNKNHYLGYRLGFTADNKIVYISDYTMEKKGAIDIPIVTGDSVASGYIDTPVWKDSNGRIIHTDGAKLYVNNNILYDATEHIFSAKKPM